MKLPGVSWVLLSVVVFATLIEVAQAVPISDGINDLDVETNLQARGWTSKMKDKAKKMFGKGESSTSRRYLLQDDRQSSGGESGRKSDVAVVTPRASVSSSSSEEIDPEILKIKEHRYPELGRADHAGNLDMIDTRMPGHWQQQHNTQHFQQFRQHYGYAGPSQQRSPSPSPRVSPQASQRNSPVRERQATAPNSPAAQKNQGGVYIGGNYFPPPSGGHIY